LNFFKKFDQKRKGVDASTPWGRPARCRISLFEKKAGEKTSYRHSDNSIPIHQMDNGAIDVNGAKQTHGASPVFAGFLEK
jgi:hypothetical protein